MKQRNSRSSLLLTCLVVVLSTIVPLHAEAKHCSTAGTAGDWAYTYTGSIFTQNVFVPAAAIGHFHQDAAGNISGSQVRSIGGSSASENISGKVNVGADCTATATIVTRCEFRASFCFSGTFSNADTGTSVPDGGAFKLIDYLAPDGSVVKEVEIENRRSSPYLHATFRAVTDAAGNIVFDSGRDCSRPTIRWTSARSVRRFPHRA